jgi:hypothetical protein
MRMLTRRRADTTDDTAATTTNDNVPASAMARASEPTTTQPTTPARRQTAAAAAPAATTRARPRWHAPTRAVMTLLAAGVAGFLAWVTTTIADTTNSGYWAVYGILAGAGLVMALSQLLGGWTKWGRPHLSPTMLLVAFVPTAVAVLWIVVFHQPATNTFRSHVTAWSHDIGIGGLVRTMGGDLLSMLAFGLGLVFGFCFDTIPRTAAVAPQSVPAPDPAAADEPMAREREVVRQ